LLSEQQQGEGGAGPVGWQAVKRRKPLLNVMMNNNNLLNMVQQGQPDSKVDKKQWTYFHATS
jgi:hypothetical protein